MRWFSGGPDKVLQQGTQGWGRIVAIRVSEKSSDESTTRVDEYVVAVAPVGRRLAVRQMLQPDDRVRLGMDVALLERGDDIVIDWVRTVGAAGVHGSNETHGWKMVKDWGGTGILDTSGGKQKAAATGIAGTARIDGFSHRSELGGLVRSLTVAATVVVPGDEPFSIELGRQTVPFYASHLAVVGLQLRCFVDAKRIDRVTLDWAEVAERHPGVGVPPSTAHAAPDAAPTVAAGTLTGDGQWVVTAPADLVAPAPIEGVSWETYLAVTRSIQQARIKPKEWDGHAQQFGVPAGRWAHISQAWAMQMMRNAALQQSYAAAMQ